LADFTKCNMFLVQHDISINDISINQSGKFTVSVKFRLTIRVRCFYISVIYLPFPSDFRDNLWVGLGIGVGVGIYGS